MGSMKWPDCVVMDNLINTHHTYTQTHTQSQDPPQREHRIMKRTRTQRWEVRGGIEERRGGAEKRKKPPNNYIGEVEKGEELAGRRTKHMSVGSVCAARGYLENNTK